MNSRDGWQNKHEMTSSFDFRGKTGIKDWRVECEKSPLKMSNLKRGKPRFEKTPQPTCARAFYNTDIARNLHVDKRVTSGVGFESEPTKTRSIRRYDQTPFEFKESTSYPHTPLMDKIIDRAHETDTPLGKMSTGLQLKHTSRKYANVKSKFKRFKQGGLVYEAQQQFQSTEEELKAVRAHNPDYTFTKVSTGRIPELDEEHGTKTLSRRPKTTEGRLGPGTFDDDKIYIGLKQRNANFSFATAPRNRKEHPSESLKNMPFHQLEHDKKQWDKNMYIDKVNKPRKTVIHKTFPPLGFDVPAEIAQRCQTDIDRPLDTGSKMTLVSTVKQLPMKYTVSFNSPVARPSTAPIVETYRRPDLGPGYMHTNKRAAIRTIRPKTRSPCFSNKDCKGVRADPRLFSSKFATLTPRFSEMPRSRLQGGDALMESYSA
jgi:hypothetical protein